MPGQSRTRGVDVARHGDVDQHQRPARALLRHQLELLAADDLVRRAGGADHDVGALELAGQVVEADGLAAEALGQPDRAVVAAVGHEHGLHAAVAQRAAP